LKWFKHDSDASLDKKLRKVRSKYGMEGYGLYWYCLELVAMNVEKHNLTFELEHDAELISDDTGIHYERVQEMMTFMVDQGLFENNSGVVTCLKMSTRTDEYTQKLISKAGGIRRLSLECPDNAPIKSELKEEKRREEKGSSDELLIFNFWKDVMGKRGNVVFTSTRRRKIKSRLADGYSVEEIKSAITNCKKSEWHQGKNEDKKEHNDIELICRTGEKLESFRDMSPSRSDGVVI
jgi:hypothetical protein